MDHTFAITRRNRELLLKFLDGYTIEQLNKVPTGFNNNLIWNISHIIVVEQMLVYKLSGLDMMIPQNMVESYMRGTKPERDVTEEEVAEIRSFLFNTIERTQRDYNDRIFRSYQPFTTSNGFTLNSAEEAITFNTYHEGIHLGMMLSIRKFI
jgi:hypothetical protein